MSSAKARTKPADGKSKEARFTSQMCPYINVMLTKRYTEKRSVNDVLKWLADQRVPSARETYQTFVRRVLNLMTDQQAKELRIDMTLLHAVRCRLKLPLSPTPGRASPVKAMPAFNCRGRQRRVVGSRKAKSVKAPPVHQTEPERLVTEQFPLPGMVGAPATDSGPKLRGTEENPVGISDWQVLNQRARKKLFARDRRIQPNYQGMVIHLKSKCSYTPEDLVAEFGLTPTESQSCFMSLPD